MRKLVVGTFVTLDGVMQAPGGPDEDRDGGFEHGGWSFSYWDEVINPLIVDQMLEMDILLLGRRTYQIFAGHWPRITDPADPVAVRSAARRAWPSRSSPISSSPWVGGASGTRARRWPA